MTTLIRASRANTGRWIRPWLGTLVGLSVALSCKESGPRVYTAQAYDVEVGCLETYAPLGLVEAEDVGAECDPVCLLLDDTVYVSTVCAPYPAETSLEDPAESPECVAALAALVAEAYCDDLGVEEGVDEGVEEGVDASAP